MQVFEPEEVCQRVVALGGSPVCLQLSRRVADHMAAAAPGRQANINHISAQGMKDVDRRIAKSLIFKKGTITEPRLINARK